jgi:hypothetical protein
MAPNNSSQLPGEKKNLPQRGHVAAAKRGTVAVIAHIQTKNVTIPSMSPPELQRCNCEWKAASKDEKGISLPATDYRDCARLQGRFLSRRHRQDLTLRVAGPAGAPADSPRGFAGYRPARGRQRRPAGLSSRHHD